MRRNRFTRLIPEPLAVARVAEELSLAIAPGFDRSRGVHRAGVTTSAAERLLRWPSPTSKETCNSDDANDNDGCDDNCVGVHCRLTAKFSGAHAAARAWHLI
jgi:hypothetical protein